MEASVPSLSNENQPKIVHLISPDFNAEHISKLILKLDNSSIKLRLQKQTDSLGIIIKQRTFVLVDNYYGQVTLGSQFSSLMMFIVGYPKIGKNKKNHYCRTPEDVISKFTYFRTLPNYEKKIYRSSSVISRSRIGSGQSIKAGNSSVNQSKEGVQAVKSLKEKWFETRRRKGKQNKQFGSKTDQNSKLFLYMRSEDEYFLKVALKIAANNPIKFKAVENINELEMSLDISRSRNNFGVVDTHFFDEVLSKKFFNVKWLVYQPGKQNLARHQIPKNIFRICTNQKELIDSIRSLGFQAVSIKDIEKSIVKYDNPFAMQKQMIRRQLKKKQLHWTNSEKKISDRLLKNQQFAHKVQTQVNISQDNIQQDKRESFMIIKPQRPKKITKYYNEYYLNTNNDEKSQKIEEIRSRASIQEKCIKRAESEYSINQICDNKSVESVKKTSEVKKIRRIFSTDFQKKKQIENQKISSVNDSENRKIVEDYQKIKKIKRIRRIGSKGKNQSLNQLYKNNFKSEKNSSVNEQTSKLTQKMSEKSSKRSLRLRSASPAFYEIIKESNSCLSISLKDKQIQKSPSAIRKRQLVTREQYYIETHKQRESNAPEINISSQNKPFFKNFNHNSTAQTNQECQQLKIQSNYQYLSKSPPSQIKNVTFGQYQQHLNHYDQFLKYQPNPKIRSVCIWKEQNFEIEMCIEKMKEIGENFEEIWSFKFAKNLELLLEEMMAKMPSHLQKEEALISFFIDQENLLQELLIIRKKLFKRAKKFPKFVSAVKKINIFVIAKSSSKQEFKKSVNKVVQTSKIRQILTQSIYETNLKPLYITDYDNYIQQQIKPALTQSSK